VSGFLNRWSKRKTDARRDPEPASPPEPAAAAQGAGADQAELQPPPPLPPPPLPDDPEIAAQIAALPPLEEITAGTDIRPFLQDFVPRALKNAAMRRAWVSDPIISTHLDVARDYAWEFNSGPLPVGFSTGLGADAVKRGLDALNIAPAPETAAQSAGTSQDGPPRDDGDQTSDAQGDVAADTAPELAAKMASLSEASPVATPDPAVLPEPAPPVTSVKAVIRLSPKKHGGALPD